MTDKNEQQDLELDVRIRTHQQRSGKLTQEQIDAYLAALPDEADEAVESNIRFSTPYADRARR